MEKYSGKEENTIIDKNVPQLSELAVDALGEAANISMGAAAKVLSSMLKLKVLITTPEVEVLHNDNFEYRSMFPAIGVSIKYIEGLSGINFFVLKQTDVKKIVGIMTENTEVDEASPLTELDISAISEVMNQMMGASSTSLATFLNRKINISTPDCMMLKENDNARESMGLSGYIVVIKLKLKIGDIIDSELVSIMSVKFANELSDNLINIQLPTHTDISNRKDTGHPVEAVTPDTDKRNAKPPRESNERKNKMQHKDTVSEAKFQDFEKETDSSEPAISNLDIIMDVPLDVVVMIGTAKKQVKDIIKLTQGSIIELEKQAGDPVDIIVNGEMIAKGDVVVIDDNFGVRITEILKNKV